MKLISSAVILLLATAGMAFDKAFINDQEFVTCYQTKADTYFFDWDPYLKTNDL